MGLLCGSAVFKKNEGKFSLLENGPYVPSDVERCAPILVSFDAMCRLTGLQGITERNYTSNVSNAWNVNGKRDREDDRPVFYPREIAMALFQPLQNFVKCHRHAHVTIAVMCDVKSDVPVEKSATQLQRTMSSSFRPYIIDIATQKVKITDEGLEIDDDPPIRIDMYAVMATRSIRPYLYQYFREWIMKHNWSESFTMVFDGDFPIVGHQAFEYVINPSEPTTEKVVEHSGTGEGEISAMVWALRMKDTHQVQVHSGDLDMLALSLIHGHKFTYDLKASLCDRYNFSYNDAIENIHKNGFIWQDIILGAIMLGTDFVTKKLVTFRANKESVFEGARSLRIIADTVDIMELVETDPEHMSVVLTAANNVFREDRKLATRSEVIDTNPFAIHIRIRRWVESRQREMQKYKVRVTEEGAKQLKFNLRYWTNL
jgi:hypothetical protein